MLKLFGSPASARAKLAAKAPAGPLRDYLLTPAPADDTPLHAARLLAVDIETTGLNPESDQLLSIGFVPVDGHVVQLGGAGQVLLRQNAAVGESARFHGLTDDTLATGDTVREALDALFSALRGRALLAHHATIETGFLNRACEQTYGVGAQFSVVDTMTIQFGLLSQGFDDEPPQGSLRLWNARGQFGLPRYAAHEALTDALACAELYLAQVAELESVRPRTLKAVLKR